MHSKGGCISRALEGWVLRGGYSLYAHKSWVQFLRTSGVGTLSGNKVGI